MMERIFGISKRLYYFITGICTISFLATAYDKIEYSKKIFDNPTLTTVVWQSRAAQEAPMFIALAFLSFPIAVVIHRIFHWIVWGKVK